MINAVLYGIVQYVGLRDTVNDIASTMQIRGYVENLKDKTMVRIVCNGEKYPIEKFIQKIKDLSMPIHVDHIDVQYSKVTENFTEFSIKYGDPHLEILKKLDVMIIIGNTIVRLLQKVIEYQLIGLKKHDQTNETLTRMEQNTAKNKEFIEKSTEAHNLHNGFDIIRKEKQKTLTKKD